MSDATMDAESAMELDDIIGFEEDPPRDGMESGAYNPDELLLNIDGYEGPIDVLLVMARDQKVDLAKISILQLTRQYLVFVDRAKAMNLDLAAEYLVMAAWLAYLKSRLLLPREESTGNEPSADQMAEALQFQLRRLEAMQNVASSLFKRPYLGNGIYTRGMTEGLSIKTDITWDVSLLDLLKTYGEIRRRREFSTFELPVFSVMTMEEALDRVTTMLGRLPRKGPYSAWVTMRSLIPEKIRDKLYGRSSMASTFTAGLELVKQGKAEIKQDGLFRPIYMRASFVERDDKEDMDGDDDSISMRNDEMEQDNNIESVDEGYDEHSHARAGA